MVNFTIAMALWNVPRPRETMEGVGDERQPQRFWLENATQIANKRLSRTQPKGVTAGVKWLEGVVATLGRWRKDGLMFGNWHLWPTNPIKLGQVGQDEKSSDGIIWQTGLVNLKRNIKHMELIEMNPLGGFFHPRLQLKRCWWGKKATSCKKMIVTQCYSYVEVAHTDSQKRMIRYELWEIISLMIQQMTHIYIYTQFTDKKGRRFGCIPVGGKIVYEPGQSPDRIHPFRSPKT